MELNKTSQFAGATPIDLTTVEVHQLLKQFGPNAMPETIVNPLREALVKFWAPVPAMLEGAIIIELVLGQLLENGQMLNFFGLSKMV